MNFDIGYSNTHHDDIQHFYLVAYAYLNIIVTFTGSLNNFFECRQGHNNGDHFKQDRCYQGSSKSTKRINYCFEGIY